MGEVKYLGLSFVSKPHDAYSASLELKHRLRALVAGSFFGYYCFDALTGDLIWSHNTGNAIHSSPALAMGLVYIGSGENVWCLDAGTGDPEWVHPTGGLVESSPAVALDRVYVGSGLRFDPSYFRPVGYFYCLDASTGEEVRSRATLRTWTPPRRSHTVRFTSALTTAFSIASAKRRAVVRAKSR